MIGRYACFVLVAVWSVCGGTAAEAETLRVNVAVVVEIPIERAWGNLQDFSVAHNYVPGLSRTEIVSSARSGIGAHRRVYDEDGDYIEETIIAWREGAGFVIKLHDGEEPMAPFERAEFSYSLVPAAPGETLVSLGMTVDLPLGAFGAKLGEWFILPVMEDNLVQVAAGIKHYYETGKPAGDEDRARLAGAVQIGPAEPTEAP